MSTPAKSGETSRAATEALLSHQLSSIPPETPVKGSTQWPKTAKEWFIGDIPWLEFLYYLVLPLSLYSKTSRDRGGMRFKTDGAFVPIFVVVVLGLQHALVALGTVVAVPLMFGSAYPFAFGPHGVQCGVIISGICTLFNCLQFKIPRTPYQIGTGMTSILGNTLIMQPTVVSLVGKIAGRNFDFLTDEGVKAAVDAYHDAYGRVLGTAAVCTIAFILVSLIPRKNIKIAFPPIVSGIIITMIGLTVTREGFTYWGGGQDCVTGELASVCNMNGNVRLPFGSTEYIGLGFLVIVLFLIIELVGTKFLRHNVILISGLIVYAVAAIVKKDGKRYVTGDEIDHATEATFLWTETYDLGFYLGGVLPFLFSYLVTYLHSMAVFTATVEESRLDIESEEADSRIQGGLIVTGIGSMFAVLGTGIPIAPIPQNNSVIYISRAASRYIGIVCSIWLLIFGVFAKVHAFFFLEVPIVVRGAVYTIVCIMVILTGLRILIRVAWDRRNTIILLGALTIGMGNIVLTNFIGRNLWMLGGDPRGFEQSIHLAIIEAMEVPYFLGGVTAIVLNLILPKEMELNPVDVLPQVEEE